MSKGKEEGIYTREEMAQGRQGRSRPLLGGLWGRTSRAGVTGRRHENSQVRCLWFSEESECG